MLGPRFGLAHLLELWNPQVYKHSRRVAHHMARLAPPEAKSCWYWAGLLHDIGKVAIPPAILEKRGRLSARERKLMRRHPWFGWEIIRASGIQAESKVIADAVLYHHERWDGKGYPYDIGGTQVPWVARVLAVVDAYVSMNSHKPYGSYRSPREARQELRRCAGSQFDPQAVRLFLNPDIRLSEGLPDESIPDEPLPVREDMEPMDQDTLW